MQRIYCIEPGPAGKSPHAKESRMTGSLWQLPAATVWALPPPYFLTTTYFSGPCLRPTSYFLTTNYFFQLRIDLPSGSA
jgi:hypothetical protein